MAIPKDRIIDFRRVPAGELLSNPSNWRTHPAAQRKALREILSKVGFAGAALARQTPEGLMLIDGHLRKDENPDALIPTLVTDLDEAEADLLLATLDPIGAMAEADTESLRDLLARVNIETKELLESLGANQVTPIEFKRDPDDVPTKAPARTKRGDVWLLGDHRVMCGDATSEVDVAKLIDGAEPFLCVTDPPYGVNYDPGWRNVEAAKGNLADAARRVGAVMNDDRADWSEAWKLFPGDVLYSWHPPGATSLIHAEALQGSGFNLRMQIIWAKSNFPIGRGDYHVRHEPCWYAVRDGKPAKRTKDRTQTTLWEINLDRNVEGGHSTQKPVECMARPMRNHEPCDVYDPFVGSGTSLIAAEMENRACYAMELEPQYVDVSVKRWEDFTGKKARKAK